MKKNNYPNLALFVINVKNLIPLDRKNYVVNSFGRIEKYDSSIKLYIPKKYINKNFYAVLDNLSLAVEHTTLPVWLTNKSRALYGNDVYELRIGMTIYNKKEAMSRSELMDRWNKIKLIDIINAKRYTSQGVIIDTVRCYLDSIRM